MQFSKSTNILTHGQQKTAHKVGKAGKGQGNATRHRLVVVEVVPDPNGDVDSDANFQAQVSGEDVVRT